MSTDASPTPPRESVKTRFGIAVTVDCVSCGETEYRPDQVETAERMAEWHDQHCGDATVVEH